MYAIQLQLLVPTCEDFVIELSSRLIHTKYQVTRASVTRE